MIKGTVKNSIVMDNSVIDENSIVEDSVIGSNVYFKGIAKSSKNAKTALKNKAVSVKNLGTIIGDNVKAVNVSIKPGAKIWPNKKISGKINKDIM